MVSEPGFSLRLAYDRIASSLWKIPVVLLQFMSLSIKSHRPLLILSIIAALVLPWQQRSLFSYRDMIGWLGRATDQNYVELTGWIIFFFW
jgi:hypothetical protein